MWSFGITIPTDGGVGVVAAGVVVVITMVGLHGVCVVGGFPWVCVDGGVHGVGGVVHCVGGVVHCVGGGVH